MKIVAISDLHGTYPKLPSADLIIIAGDVMGPRDLGDQIVDWNKVVKPWLEGLDATKVILVGGNHDFILQDMRKYATEDLAKHIVYLEDSFTTLNGMVIWGSPWTPPFYNWAFMREEADLENIFAQIPLNTDILVTHGPPFGTLDDGLGSKALKNRLQTVKPKLHFFGHIHEGYGGVTSENRGAGAFNCSFMTRDYKPRNKYWEINL